MALSPNQEAIRRAVDAAGGQSALARALSVGEVVVKQGHVFDWINRESGAPFEHCPAIEAATGVRCEELRAEVEWQRDDEGRAVSYTVPLAPADQAAA
jgi:DNA-binding transcriptional regulator YdaS (Cro superfamily)